jgi:hypothetical protein
MRPQTTALAAADGDGSAPIVGRIEPRGYRQPLISNSGLEEVEVEGSTAAWWPVLGGAEKHGDPNAAGRPGGAGAVVEQSGGGVREIGFGLRLAFGRGGGSLYPAAITDGRGWGR